MSNQSFVQFNWAFVIFKKKKMQSEGTICDESSTDSDPSQEKWSCEFCTYENYQVSHRCCMWRTPRTPTTKLIFENQHNQNAAINAAVSRKMSSGSLFGTADIFKLGASVPTSTTPSTPTSTPSNNNNLQKLNQSRSSSPLMSQIHNAAYIYSGQADVEQVNKWSCQTW